MAMFVWRGDVMSALLPRISTRQLSASSFHAHNRGHSLVGFLLNNQRGGDIKDISIMILNILMQPIYS